MSPESTGPVGAAALAWLPAGDYEQAVQRVSPFTAWCAERDQQPDSAEARAEYAAHLAASADPDLIAWPPGRNQPCWCGSGRKYKKCCAAMTFVDTDLSQ
jgi:uncharacterized protein YecA (UPF0149 family)